MVRTQILLTEEQHAFLRELSRKTGLPLSELVRRAVDELRQSNDVPVKRALKLVGAFRADRDDISERHDEFFLEGS